MHWNQSETCDTVFIDLSSMNIFVWTFLPQGAGMAKQTHLRAPGVFKSGTNARSHGLTASAGCSLITCRNGELRARPAERLRPTQEHECESEFTCRVFGLAAGYDHSVRGVCEV